MIVVHHLNNSRSQHILWLLEELGVDYQIVAYQRDAVTNLAPASLEAVHPLGKSPVVVDAGETLIESGAIVEILVRRHGKGRLAPPEGSPEHSRYLQLLHYAEGSAMLPVMLKLYLARLGEAGAPLAPRVTSEIERHFGYLDSLLTRSAYFLGDTLSAADIHLSFPIQAARLLHGLQKLPNLARFLERITVRPAYQRALEKGGSYAF